MSPKKTDKPAKPEPLPMQVVERIWEKLTLRYGHAFLSRWEGMKLLPVKVEWRYTLDGLSAEQIEWGLANLPAGRAPEVGEFKQICQRMPEQAGIALPPPTEPRKVPPKIAEAINHVLRRMDTNEPLRVTTARNYLRRWEGQPNLTPMRAANVAHYRRIVDDFERAGRDKELAQKKAETQQRVDQYLAGAGT
jgi:hypothetical protein